MKRLLLTAALAVIGTVGVNAATLVNWGGDYVSAVQAFQRGAGTATSNFGNVGGTATLDSRRQLTFSESTALNPSSGYSGTSATFYGGAQTIRYDNSASPNTFGKFDVANNGTTDRLRFRGDGGATGAGTGEFAGLAVWEKADFLNLSVATITFDSLSTFSVTIDTTSANLGVVRWLVKDGSTFYVSNVSYNSTGTKTLTDMSTTTWATYAPSTELNFAQGSATFAAHTFTDVAAVGLYFDNDAVTWTSQTAGAPDFEFSGFSVTAVPEPSTYALLGLGFAGLLVLRRMKKSTKA